MTTSARASSNRQTAASSGPSRPTSSQLIEQRLTARLATERHIIYRDRHHWVKGTIRNISEGGGGALLVVEAQHVPKEVARFRVSIDDQIIPFRAQTVWTRLINGEYHLGVRFIEPDK